MTITKSLQTFGAYWRARRIDSIRNVSEITAIQQRWLDRSLKAVSRDSPFYRQYGGKELSEWPVMTKSNWMHFFDKINTVGAQRATIEDIALTAERSRNFSSEWCGYSVGLSTGTSGARGLFIASPGERSRWAGTILGRLLRHGLLAHERIALILRAGNTLYDSVNSLRLQFRYFDLAQPWQQLCKAIVEFSPTILVGTPQHLSRLVSETVRPAPRRVISVAEVLDEVDQAHIKAGFGVPVEQIYQATEGLLGMSCEFNNVHLNEPYMVVEREWQDAEKTRFVPIVTDLWRRTQPVIRYRLDDVLRLLPEPCPCGRPTTALANIDGRYDDVLWLSGPSGIGPVFPDLVTRTLVRAVPMIEDYEVIERARGQWTIRLSPIIDNSVYSKLNDEFRVLAKQLNLQPPSIELELLPRYTLALTKRRRVRGLRDKACAS
ncbi:MAG TPA: F390 synthetase-related protein [Steroidobacteraceae bacterium]|nr:F390 synthetase-related protein [Steroidobacteraceae bacterium]